MLQRLRGYTMVEILIVIAIIGILLAVALPNIAAVRRRSQDEKLVADLGVLETGLQQYRQQCKVYPRGDSSGKLTGAENNGLPGIGQCASKLQDFLPKGFVIDAAKVQYYGLRRPTSDGGANGRCTSYRLGVILSGSDATPIKRKETRGWNWVVDSKDVFKWDLCSGGAVPDLHQSAYDAITPAPY